MIVRCFHTCHHASNLDLCIALMLNFLMTLGTVVSPSCVLPLTENNVEKVLDEVRPGLMADGGNVVLHEIDGLIVVLKLQGACGSCPSSTMTLKMGIETRLRDKIPEIESVEQILDTETGLELNEENVEKVMDELSLKGHATLWQVNLKYFSPFYGRRESAKVLKEMP